MKKGTNCSVLVPYKEKLARKVDETMPIENIMQCVHRCGKNYVTTMESLKRMMSGFAGAFGF